MHPLIDCRDLARRFDAVRLCDIRWALTDPKHGRSAYEAGHIPAAVFVDLESDLSGPPVLGRHPLPAADLFANTLGRLGIRPEDEVVVYDDMNGAVAARMWWMLRSVGHEKSRLLNGGFETWRSMGLPVETGSNRPTTVKYPTPASFTGVVTHDRLSGRDIVDARASERYTGENEPIDPKAGHIPGAINKPISGNLDASGLFLDPALLRVRYSDVTPNPVMSCGSGVTACHNALAFVLADHDMPDVYIGSFSEWSRLGKPVESGDGG